MIPLPLWLSETAEEFWSAAGGPEGFPRNLRGPIANALPLTVVSLPRLQVVAVDRWLRRQGIAGPSLAADRALRACLVARNGYGFIFIDGTDSDAEQRFSLAHELAHFLRDYQQPRLTAIERLGSAIEAVLDGERPPDPTERIQALLARARLGFQVHLMDRTPDGRFSTAAIDVAERGANLLAFELLAPAAAVLDAPRALNRDLPEQRASVERRLIGDFGLPAGPASQYAAILVPDQGEPGAFLRQLGRAIRDDLGQNPGARRVRSGRGLLP